MLTAFKIFSFSGVIFEILALLFALIFYSKYRSTKLYITLPFLVYLVITELFCKFVYHQHNLMFYNPLLVIEGLFYLYGFYITFSFGLFKKIAMAAIIIFLIVSVVNLLLISSINEELVTYSYSMGCVFLILLYLLYIYSLLKNEEIQQPNQQLFFWIAHGIFIFIILRVIPEFIINNHGNNLSINQNAFLKIIKYLASDILYSFFIIGFVKCKKTILYSK
jgi:hypothetical protein